MGARAINVLAVDEKKKTMVSHIDIAARRWTEVIVMAIKPILFSTEMVRAILDGRKTQTRRIAFEHDDLREFKSEAYPEGWWYKGRVFKTFDDFLHYPQSPRCMYAPGDIIWVRETWDCIPASPGGHFRFSGRYYYKADGDIRPDGWKGNWKPSIHMQKEAARIFLHVKDVRLERLQDINDDGVVSEGLEIGDPFDELWDSTVKKTDLPLYGWNANPWVWVIKFERCEKSEGWCK